MLNSETLIDKYAKLTSNVCNYDLMIIMNRVLSFACKSTTDLVKMCKSFKKQSQIMLFSASDLRPLNIIVHDSYVRQTYMNKNLEF